MIIIKNNNDKTKNCIIIIIIILIIMCFIVIIVIISVITIIVVFVIVTFIHLYNYICMCVCVCSRPNVLRDGHATMNKSLMVISFKTCSGHQNSEFYGWPKPIQNPAWLTAAHRENWKWWNEHNFPTIILKLDSWAHVMGGISSHNMFDCWRWMLVKVWIFHTYSMRHVDALLFHTSILHHIHIPYPLVI